MDLDFSEEQQLLRETVRRLCAEYAPIASVRAMEDDPTGYPAELWKQLAEVGITGIAISESHGGSAQSLLEAAIVYEEMGRALTPSPHFASAVMSFVSAGLVLFSASSMGVSVSGGYATETPMPSDRSSARSVSASPRTANFDGPYEE